MYNLIKTTDIKAIKDIFNKFNLPKHNSYKGQNGKVLIIGGSLLFHAASLWSAEIASYFVDIVHYCSTKENQRIFLNLKTKFRNGIIIHKKNLIEYVIEDDAILVGPGMIRKDILKMESKILKMDVNNQKDLINIKDEGLYTYFLTKFLIYNFPQKKFVFDAGALQMMNKEWFLKLKTPAIITPHQKEFEKLFNERIFGLKFEKKVDLVKKYAQDYKIIILLKAIKDIISDGRDVYVIEGGNQGLTKGGSGDVLAGLVTSFYAKNYSLLSAVFASIILKKTADFLFLEKGYWYNIKDIIENIPKIFKKIIF